MHTYIPSQTYIHPVKTEGESPREYFYRQVRRVYEFGYYDFAQGLFHLLEDGCPTDNIRLYWDKIVRENPHILTQSGTSGCSLHTMRG